MFMSRAPHLQRTEVPKCRDCVFFQPVYKKIGVKRTESRSDSKHFLDSLPRISFAKLGNPTTNTMYESELDYHRSVCNKFSKLNIDSDNNTITTPEYALHCRQEDHLCGPEGEFFHEAEKKDVKCNCKL